MKRIIGQVHNKKYKVLTSKQWAKMPDRDGTQTCKLSVRDFNQEEGHSTSNQEKYVGDQENSCKI